MPETQSKQPKKPKPNTASKLCAQIIAILEDNKAMNLVCLSLMGKCDFADCMIIVSGSSARHVASIAEDLRKKLPNKPYLEGIETADWVVIDAFDVVVHVMREEVRGYYKIENIWGGDIPKNPSELIKIG